MNRKLDKKNTRFYKTAEGLEKGIARFNLPQPAIIVETVDGWTAIYNGQNLHNAGYPVVAAAHRGFVTI